MQQRGLWDVPHPWLDLMLAASRARTFISTTMDELLVEDMGEGPVTFSPLVRSHFSTPFLRLPVDHAKTAQLPRDGLQTHARAGDEAKLAQAGAASVK
jgi:hypothetical protein